MSTPSRLLEKHYSLGELSMLLGVDRRTLRRVIDTGELKPVRRIAGKDVVPASAVTAWLDRCTYTAA